MAATLVRNRHWRSWRTLAIAIAFLAIGMCQFACSPTDPPDCCLGLMSPLDRLCYWLKLGSQAPITDVFDHYELVRFAISTVCTMMLAGTLAWSTGNQGLPSWRFRIRTLMLIVAVLPVAWLAGQATWGTWKRFDDYCHYAGRHSPYEELEKRLDKSLADPSAYIYGGEAVRLIAGTGAKGGPSRLTPTQSRRATENDASLTAKFVNDAEFSPAQRQRGLLKSRHQWSGNFRPRVLRKASPPLRRGGQGGSVPADADTKPSRNRENDLSLTAKFVNDAEFSPAQGHVGTVTEKVAIRGGGNFRPRALCAKLPPLTKGGSRGARPGGRVPRVAGAHHSHSCSYSYSYSYSQSGPPR